MEKLLFKRVELWLVLLIFVLLLIPVILFGAVVRNHALGYNKYGFAGDAALAIAEIPSVIRTLAREGRSMQAFHSAAVDGKSGWNFHDGAREISDMLLLSRYDGDQNRHIVEIVDFSTGKVLHTWAPDAPTILDGVDWASENVSFEHWDNFGFRYIHPFLDSKGGLLVKDHDSPMMKLDECGNLEWRQERSVFHHSTEQAPDGTFWISGRADPPRTPDVGPEFMDDELVQITADGDILATIPLTEIFEKNSMVPIMPLTGTDKFTANAYLSDPFHLNDIQPVVSNGSFWQVGDLFVSLRNQSMIMLYRPSTGKVVWSKRGPWMAQHDVDVLDDHRIAVFNNNTNPTSVRGPDQVHGVNEIVIYDFSTDKVSRPWAPQFEREQIRTRSEGLFQFASSGQLLVEEENQGRILVFSGEGDVIAEFVNRASDGNTYRLGWSRLVKRDAAQMALAALRIAECG